MKDELYIIFPFQENDLAIAFDETDQDMLITEDPLPCIVNQGAFPFPCLKCSHSFYDAENLKRHTENCHGQVKEWHCRYCSKVFHRDQNKLFHERNCEQGPGISRKRQQQTIDNYVSKISKGEYQVGAGQDGVTIEEKEPTLIESSLKYTAKLYRKEFDQGNRRNLLNRLQHSLNHFKPIIARDTLLSKQSVKWYLSLNMDFVKAADVSVKTDPSVTFRSEVFCSLNANKLDETFEAGYNQIVQLIDEFQQNGSGWVVDKFVAIDLGKQYFITVFISVFLLVNKHLLYFRGLFCKK